MFIVLEFLLLAFSYHDSLTHHGLWNNLIMAIWQTTYIVVFARFMKPPGPDAYRYEFMLTSFDKQVLLIAVSLPGAVLVAVIAYLIAHAVRAV